MARYTPALSPMQNKDAIKRKDCYLISVNDRLKIWGISRDGDQQFYIVIEYSSETNDGKRECYMVNVLIMWSLSRSWTCRISESFYGEDPSI